jgi:Xaa-Pro dipeptidase
MKNFIEQRVKRIFAHLDGKGKPEAILIYNRDRIDKNFLYLTGMNGGVFENCGVLCERDGRTYIFTTTLEEEILRGIKERTEIVVYKNEQERNDKLKKVLSQYRCLGLVFETISHSFYLNLAELLNSIELVDASKAFKMARMIKSPDEINNIREACRIASRIADEFPSYLKKGITELELAAEVDYRMRLYGAQGAAFATIVAFAENSSKPHYIGGSVPLRRGNVILLDFGAEYKGYVSDITRTYFTGKPDKEMENCYNTVLQAQKIALDLIGDGIGIEKVENEVKNFIDSHQKFKGRFIHGLGHSIGLTVHDNSFPGSDFNKTFQENMVLTVEPGIYLPGLYGIRIEDDILVQKNSCSILTTALKEPRVYEI